MLIKDPTSLWVTLTPVPPVTVQDTMLPLWRLVLLCGLLTGTSASLLDNNVVRELQSALRKELETDDSASERESESGMTRGTCFSNFEKIQFFIFYLSSTLFKLNILFIFEAYSSVGSFNLLDNLYYLIGN